MKTKLSTLEKKLDKIFSQYIRLSHANDKGMCICVSCGVMKHWQDIDAGHFYSRRHKSVRWSELNCKPECRKCNRFDTDHLHGYHAYMLKEHGNAGLELLTEMKNRTWKFDRVTLEGLIESFTESVKQLKKEKGL